MPASVSVLKFAFITEGHGEIEAMPLLVRRICSEILGFYAFPTTRPVRVSRSKLVRAGEFERAVKLALSATEGNGAVLVVVDADEDSSCLLGPMLKNRALAITQPQRLSILAPLYEFETWFLTSAESLSGVRSLRNGLVPPSNPEAIRGAKEWLSRNMVAGRKYSPTVDQAALVGRMDLTAARSCRSFDRLCREIERLVTSRSSGL